MIFGTLWCMSVAIHPPLSRAASCSALLIVVRRLSRQRVGVTCCWGLACGRGPLTSLGSRGVPSVLSGLSVSLLDWQVQSNYSVPWGPGERRRLTPVTHLSQDNASRSHPLDLPLCVLIELQHKLVPWAFRVIENVILGKKKKKRGGRQRDQRKCKDAHQWTWLHPSEAAVQLSSWKLILAHGVLIFMENSSAAFVGVDWCQDFRETVKGLCRPLKWSHVPPVCCRQSVAFWGASSLLALSRFLLAYRKAIMPPCAAYSIVSVKRKSGQLE